MKNGDIKIMLQDYNEVCKEINNFPKKEKPSNLNMFKLNTIDDVKVLYKKLKDNNVKFFMEFNETDYGTVEMGIYDPDENMIIISV